MAKFHMDDGEYKRRVQNSILKAADKTLKLLKGPSRRNAHPEKDVEKACVQLMRSWNWVVQIIESKACYNPSVGRWIGQSAKQGTSDCLGVTSTGVAVAIEFKADGKLSTLRENQREFLIERINQYSFAVVVDSPGLLEEYRNRWEFLRKTGNLDTSRDYLLACVPKK